MKKVYFLLSLIISLAVFSVVSVSGAKAQNKVASPAATQTTVKTTAVEKIISKGDTMVENRLEALNRLQIRVQADKQLSESDKSSLLSQIASEGASLRALKQQVDAATDETTAKADAKEIVTTHLIYRVFEPKIRLTIVTENLLRVTANLQTLVPQIQNVLDGLKDGGADTTKPQAALDDISSLLKTMETTLTADLAKIKAVTPQTTKPETSFTAVRKDLSQIVRTDLAKIRADFAKMRPLINDLVKQSTTTKVSSPSASPSTAASPSATTSPSGSSAP